MKLKVIKLLFNYYIINYNSIYKMANLSRLTQKRLVNEIKRVEPSDMYQIYYSESEELTYYFLIRLDAQPYENGYYIGKIIVPSDYPKNPGDFYLLTPNGRFMTNNKICMSNTSYHKDQWAAAGWNIERMVQGIISMFYNLEEHGISFITTEESEKLKLRDESIAYNKFHLEKIFTKFDRFVNPDMSLIPIETVRKDLENSKKKPKKGSAKTEEPPTA
jgi:ubiquitin-conjugating enzyme E2 J2